ncbi:MAG: hypothetical protein WCH74_08130, partial [Chloroflexota bacterium]
MTTPGLLGGSVAILLASRLVPGAFAGTLATARAAMIDGVLTDRRAKALGVAMLARIRYSAGQDDLTRAGRRQHVLVAARDQLVRKGLRVDVPSLLGALAKTVRTDIPRSLLPTLADFARKTDARDVAQAVVEPPLVAHGSNAYGSVLIPDVEAIRAVASGLFSATGTPPAGWPPAAPTPTPDPDKAKEPKPTPLECR